MLKLIINLVLSFSSLVLMPSESKKEEVTCFEQIQTKQMEQLEYTSYYTLPLVKELRRTI